MKVGLLLIATNRYITFVKDILESADKYFFKGFDRQVYLFTDDMTLEVPDKIDFKVKKIEIPCYKFPEATIKRFEIFVDNNYELSKCNYLYYSDVDMLFVDNVGIETLPDESELTATQHCGFWKGGGSWCDNKNSTAYTEKKDKYFAGGFYGGTFEAFMLMSRLLSENIKTDAKNGEMAEWHDESHLNCYLSRRNPLVLSPSYCFPQNPERKKWFNGGEKIFSPKIIALDKDHKLLRK